MERIKQTQDVKKFIILISIGLMMTLAIGCGQSSSVSTTLPTPVPTPAPPEKFFPVTVANFNLSSTPKYNEAKSTKCACQSFDAIYGNGKIVGVYGVEIYKSPEEARQAFDAKKYLEQTSEIIKQTEKELVAIRKIDGSVTTVRLAGTNLIIVGGRKDSVVIIENNLPYQTLGIAKPPLRKIEEFLETPILASLVQKEFEANQADAAKKYGGNFVLLQGKVAKFGDDLEIKTVIPKTTPRKTPSPSRTPKRPTRSQILDSITKSLRTTPTPTPMPTPRKVEVHHPFVVLDLSVKSGEPIEIWCYFNELEVKKVLELKEGQGILFRGRITFVEGKLQISDARIEDTKYEGVKY